jgi:hypothetical protein
MAQIRFRDALFGGALLSAGLAHGQPQLELIDTGDYSGYVYAYTYLGAGSYEVASFDAFVGQVTTGTTSEAVATNTQLPTLLRCEAVTIQPSFSDGAVASSGTALNFFVNDPVRIRVSWDFGDDATSGSLFTITADSSLLFSVFNGPNPLTQQGSAEFDLDPLVFEYSVNLAASASATFGATNTAFVEVAVIDSEPPCLPDVNGDGIVSPTDFSAWVGAFNSGAPGCDQNSDGQCTPTDFSAWISNFNAGCP